MYLQNTFDLTLLQKAKRAFTTRRVPQKTACGLCPQTGDARAGDLVLCEVVAVGQHRNVQLSDRRLSQLYPCDLLVLVLGDRYAPDQFHATATLSGETAIWLREGVL